MVSPVPGLRGPGIGARRVENRAPHPVDAAHGLPVQSARVVGDALDIVRIDAEKSLPAPPEAGHFPAQIQRGKRSEEHTSELQSLMRISYAVFCLKKKHSTQTRSSNESTHATTDTTTKHLHTTPHNMHALCH